ncbi:MAG: LptA/OstA family protein [Alphaproteobacteria bacterium]
MRITKPKYNRHCEEAKPTRQSTFKVWIASLTLAMTLFSPSSFAQSPIPANSEEPLEITADGALEWQRNEKLFIAEGNALAQQGETSVAASKLTAHYRDGEGGSGMQISEVEADGDVIIRSRDSEAYGQHAIYNIDTGKAVMTGNNLKLVSPDQTVTARDRFEYWANEGKLVAIGNADVLRGTDHLQADRASAVMKDDATGKRVLHTLDATGNVIITTPAEIITGAYAIYRADTNKAEMTGGVTIKRGPNTLQGDRAEVDLTTNTSRIFGSAGSTGAGKQVKAVFYPDSQKKLEENSPAQ